MGSPAFQKEARLAEQRHLQEQAEAAAQQQQQGQGQAPASPWNPSLVLQDQATRGLLQQMKEGQEGSGNEQPEAASEASQSSGSAPSTGATASSPVAAPLPSDVVEADYVLEQQGARHLTQAGPQEELQSEVSRQGPEGAATATALRCTDAPLGLGLFEVPLGYASFFPTR